MKTVKTLLPDIVITDVKMPVIDGMELTKMIHTFDAEIKVIVLSSYDDYTYVRQCMKHGAIDYLLKPINCFYGGHAKRIAQARRRKRRNRPF